MNYTVILGTTILSVFIHFHAVQTDAGTARSEAIQPLVTTSELVVGTNRFAFGLLKEQKLLEGADVTLRLYSIDGSQINLARELKAPYQKVSNLKQKHAVHRHADGTEHVHGDTSGIPGRDGVEVVTFDKPGTYLVIWARKNHFVDDGMFGYVEVLPGNDP